MVVVFCWAVQTAPGRPGPLGGEDIAIQLHIDHHEGCFQTNRVAHFLTPTYQPKTSNRRCSRPAWDGTLQPTTPERPTAIKGDLHGVVDDETPAQEERFDVFYRYRRRSSTLSSAAGATRAKEDEAATPVKARPTSGSSKRYQVGAIEMKAFLDCFCFSRCVLSRSDCGFQVNRLYVVDRRQPPSEATKTTRPSKTP